MLRGVGNGATDILKIAKRQALDRGIGSAVQVAGRSLSPGPIVYSKLPIRLGIGVSRIRPKQIAFPKYIEVDEIQISVRLLQLLAIGSDSVNVCQRQPVGSQHAVFCHVTGEAGECSLPQPQPIRSIEIPDDPATDRRLLHRANAAFRIVKIVVGSIVKHIARTVVAWVTTRTVGVPIIDPVIAGGEVEVERGLHLIRSRRYGFHVTVPEVIVSFLNDIRHARHGARQI